MTLFKNVMVVCALGLLGLSCGDDKKKDTTGDAGGGAGGDRDTGTEDGGAALCKGTFEGYAEEDVLAKVGTGKCASAADVKGLCTADPRAEASKVGLACLMEYNGDTTIPDADKPAKIAECTLAQLRKDGALEGISGECLSCYSGSVLCAITNCAGPCGMPTSEACVTCRAEKGCTAGFFTCSGLPTPDQLGASK